MISLSSTTLGRLWRFYKIGFINTLFGYGIYALLLSVGLNMYAAQIIGHVIGVIFNYFSYSLHVFRAAPASKLRFLFSYALNYMVGLASLALAATILSSPYLAGLLAMVITSVINFIILQRYVFTSDRMQSHSRSAAAGSESINNAS
ncbi:GtrA family protein [Sphingobium sp. MI1205]|uniref:GtrA family protein n=1 Tax=Sphingobium sp. MI1205 TaxID=407020 RepID=UPI0007705973|nr:GtrA family protein [Sphingobium sp. MI1205]AMK18876.1 GtrA family protein [Sphingobium sp. MI1205]